MLEMKYADSLKLVAGLLLSANVALLGAKLTDRPAAPKTEVESGGLRVLGPAPLELPRLCLRWSNFTHADYPALRDWLSRQAGQHRITLTRSSGWWAWLPPQQRKEAEATLKKLQAAWFADALVVRGGPMRTATALGVFDSEESACARRDEVIKAGFAKAACGPRPLPLTGGTLLTLGGGDAELTQTLSAAFPKARIVGTDCPTASPPPSL